MPARQSVELNAGLTPSSSASGKTGETVSIWHAHRREHLRIHLVILADHAVEPQDVGYHRVYLVIPKRLGVVEWHGAPHIVEDGRSVGPETADRLDRCVAWLQRSLSADQLIVRLARALLAVTREAFGEIDLLALLRSPATGRQARAIGADADVP